MRDENYAELLGEVRSALQGGKTAGILGLAEFTVRLIEDLSQSGLLEMCSAVYTAKWDESVRLAVPIRSLERLTADSPDVLVVATDEGKEDLLLEALPHIAGQPSVVLAGYNHFSFRDREFSDLQESLVVPSLANGYPLSLVHLYQCLENAARVGASGVVAEFGTFKGGTTMFLAKAIARLGQRWPVISFDTFDGFPPPRSVLDMYAHPDCVYRDQAAVERYLAEERVEIVAGDIVDTCRRLDSENIVVSFIDTDNYTPARAALEEVIDRTVIGGSIVLDHFTGVDRFKYTLGERMAALPLLNDRRFFHLHGTGVFLRQQV